MAERGLLVPVASRCRCSRDAGQRPPDSTSAIAHDVARESRAVSRGDARDGAGDASAMRTAYPVSSTEATASAPQSATSASGTHDEEVVRGGARVWRRCQTPSR